MVARQTRFASIRLGVLFTGLCAIFAWQWMTITRSADLFFAPQRLAIQAPTARAELDLSDLSKQAPWGLTAPTTATEHPEFPAAQQAATRASIPPALKQRPKRLATDTTNAALHSLQMLKKLLHDQQYEEFISFYASIYNGLDEAGVTLHNNAIMAHIYWLANRKKHAQIQQLISAYAQVFPAQIELLALLSGSQHLAKNYTGEVDTLLQILNATFDPLKRDKLETQIAAAAAHHSDNQTLRIQTYQNILRRHPNLPRIELAYAKALLEVLKIPEAKAIIAKYEWDSKYRQKIMALKSMAVELANYWPENGAQTSAISATKTRAGYTISAWINGHSATLLVDFGLTLTSLHPRFLATAGLDPSKAIKRQIATLSGITHPYVLKIEKFQVGQHTLDGFDIRVLDASQSGAVDGILGRNFLLKHPITLNTQQSALALAQK